MRNSADPGGRPPLVQRHRAPTAATLAVVVALMVTLLGGCTPSSDSRGGPTGGASGLPGSTLPHHTVKKPTAPITKPPIVTPGQRVVAQGYFQKSAAGTGLALCDLWFEKPIPDYYDGCHVSVPVAGLVWDDLPSQFMVVEGIWDGQQLHVDAIVDLGEEYDQRWGAWMTAFGYPGRTWDDRSPACTPQVTNPSLGTPRAALATADVRPDHEAGYQNGKVVNLFVTKGVAETTSAVREGYGGPLCVKLGRGVTKAQAKAAATTLDQYQEWINQWPGPQVDHGGVLVIVSPPVLTPEIYRQVVDLAGPAAPALRFFPGLYPLPSDQS